MCSDPMTVFFPQSEVLPLFLPDNYRCSTGSSRIKKQEHYTLLLFFFYFFYKLIYVQLTAIFQKTMLTVVI